MPAHRVVQTIRFLAAHKLPVRAKRVPRPLQPDAIRMEYFKAVRAAALAPARALVAKHLLPELARIVGAHADARLDAEDLGAIMDRVSREFYDEHLAPRELADLARTYAKRTSKFQKDQLQKQVRAALGVDVFAAEPHLVPAEQRFVTENVALIKTVPAKYFSDVETTVARGVREGRRAEDIAEDLVECAGVAEDRALLIARDQIGKYNGALNQERQEEMGVDQFVWRTVHDGRVREEHAALDGQTFPWDAPPSEGIPGEPVNCRCYAEPDFSAILGDGQDDS